VRTAFSCVKNVSDMAIAWGEFVLKLSTAFSMQKCFHMRLCSVGL
jgi:hypothetical protein